MTMTTPTQVLAHRTVPAALAKSYSAVLASAGPADPDPGVVEALVAITGNLDDGGDIIIPGAFTHSRRPKIFGSHDPDALAAKVLDMAEWLPGDPRLPADLRAKGYGALWMRVLFDLEDPDGQKWYRRVMFHDDLGWSIGYLMPKGTVKIATGQDGWPKGAKLLSVVDVYEASPVSLGMNVEARTHAKAWVELTGSIEERLSMVRGAVREWLETTVPGGDTDGWWIDVQATYDDRVVARLVEWEGAAQATLEFPYTIGVEGVVLGEPREVELAVTVVPAAEG